MTQAKAGRPRRSLSNSARWLAAGLVVALLVAVSWWAGRVTTSSGVDVSAEVTPVTATVVEAGVGRSLSLNVTVLRPFVPVATNGLSGTVTVVEPVTQVAVGDVLYAVDTMPVRAVVGQTPFWRDLTAGVRGPDVTQLQHALTELGHYRGEVDGRFQLGTTEAVASWQRDLGMPATGSVLLGELVAVPELPAALGLDEQIIAGARLSGGEPAVYAATGDVEFLLVVTANQAGLIPPDATVSIEFEDHQWTAVIAGSETGDDGNIRFELADPTGGLACGDDCDRLPATERTTLRAQVTIVPEVTGPTVPVAAVQTDPDGTAWVTMADGSRREVSVLGSAGGVAVVDGVMVGEQVRVIDPTGDVPDSQPADDHIDEVDPAPSQPARD